jgi:DNA repair protein RecO (recombination protein O)
MPPVQTRALVLHAFPYGDTSRILRILTRDFGLRSVIAKGAQSPRSRFGGILEPFTEGDAQFNLRDGRDLFALSGFTLIRSRQGIGRDLAAFAGASLLAEIVLRLGTEEPQPDFFIFLVDALDRLAEPQNDASATALGTLWLAIGHLGFQPEMESCVHCGRHFDERESSRFDAQAGGAACLLCRPTGRQLPGRIRHEIARMSRGDTPQEIPHDRALHGAVFHAFISAHLTLDRPFRALPLFLEQLR